MFKFEVPPCGHFFFNRSISSSYWNILRWVAGMRINLLVHLMTASVRIAVLVYSKRCSCVGCDSGDRLSETTPRAAATTREARTPTAAQYNSTVLETLPRPAYYFGQAAAATFFFVSSALTGCRLLRCIWHERGQSTNTNQIGFRHQHTQRGILTDHG